MSTKTIKVNTALFRTSRKSKKPKKKGRLKSDFMQKVRAIQAQREKDLRTPKPTAAPATSTDTEFTKSLQFLGDAAKPVAAPSIPAVHPAGSPAPCVKVAVPASSPVPRVEIASPPDPSTKPAPPYSSLKHDVLPTYRQWRSQTRKAQSAPDACLISRVPPPKPNNLRRKTLRLGKRGRVVGVLVQGVKERSKNRQARGKMKNVEVTSR